MPIRHANAGSKSWKKTFDDVAAREHGFKVYLVDGAFIRSRWDSDWVQGGHGYRYTFCPKDEIWIDDTLPVKERPFVFLHELYEVVKMRDEGWTYDRAHTAAKRIENQFRRKLLMRK